MILDFGEVLTAQWERKWARTWKCLCCGRERVEHTAGEGDRAVSDPEYDESTHL
jgi:hypothetical protein